MKPHETEEGTVLVESGDEAFALAIASTLFAESLSGADKVRTRVINLADRLRGIGYQVARGEVEPPVPLRGEVGRLAVAALRFAAAYHHFEQFRNDAANVVQEYDRLKSNLGASTEQTDNQSNE